MKIHLTAKYNNWERFLARKSRTLFKKIKAEIHARDQYTCKFCNVKTHSLEVINADNNYSRNTESNLISACEFCAQCTLLDRYKIDYTGDDKIIYCPDMTQEQLNAICRILFCKMHSNDGEAAYNAKMVYAQLQDLANWLDEKLAVKMSSPAMFVHYLNLDNHDPKIISKLRFLASPETFKDQIPVWQKEFEHDLAKIATAM